MKRRTIKQGNVGTRRKITSRSKQIGNPARAKKPSTVRKRSGLIG